jgi:hypothetical protein
MAAKESKSTAVAEKAQTEVSTSVMDMSMLQADSGMGRETMGIADMALPYLAILQALSPQISKANPKYNKEADEGDIYNTVTEELYSGDEGILILPCAYQKAFVEWKHRDTGGGWVASHENGDILKKTTRDEKNMDRLPNGNVVVETAYYYSLQLEKKDGQYAAKPAIVSMSRTQLKKARKWNSMMNGIQLEGPGGQLFNPSMFSHIYKLTTVPESKNNNNWFSWNIILYERVNNLDLYQAARKLSQDVSKGLVKASAPTEDFETIAEEHDAF